MGAMIAHLSGSIVSHGSGFIVLEVSNVGYKVHLSADTFANIKNKTKVSLWTHLAVRENALDLYGFSSEEDLSFFEMLVSISGIGPKSGLAILSLADVATLKSAVITGNSSYLTKVSGIGKKNAEKIILELKDKLGEDATANVGADLKKTTDTLEALVALGYRHNEAREALRQVPDKMVGTSERLKEALKILGGN